MDAARIFDAARRWARGSRPSARIERGEGPRRLRSRLGARPEVYGAATLVILLGAWCLPALGLRGAIRERTLDRLLPLLPERPPPAPGVAIVDIDRGTLAQVGPWPWPRARLAALVAAVDDGRPAAVALDMLLSGADRFSARALLAKPSDALLAALPDGDAALAGALAAAPSVLGFALDSGSAGDDLPATPILARTPIAVPDIWQADGLSAPPADLVAAAQGMGALVTEPDRDGPIRRVPLLVVAGGVVRPGLAVEAVRVAGKAGSLLIDDDGRLQAAMATAPLGPDASLRLIQAAPETWTDRTVSARRLLDDPTAAAALAGRIVLIGSSAPELGGLRPTPASPATPSVQIQAEAVATLLRGDIPYRPAWLGPIEAGCALLLGAAGVVMAVRLRPWPAAASMFAGCLAWFGCAIAAVPALALLVDPAGPPLIALLTLAATALARFARDEVRARMLRASFEQHVAPAVVRRIAADPGAVRLQGECREITALFTDIEGFTGMTERADPADLVALLDAYFDAAAKVVTEHEGMVMKFVGDAVQAIFNAPFGLDDHPGRAVACALALLTATEAMRASPRGQRLRLGRTRIGIETGPAIVGDVGGSRKLDYTAYGNAMNTAARLESLNKDLGTSICIGPGAAAQLDMASLREIGLMTLRGQSRPVRVFTPAVLAERVISPRLRPP